MAEKYGSCAFKRWRQDRILQQGACGNLSRKFCNESAAQKIHVDNKRKMDHRKEAKPRSLVEACKTTRMKLIASFFQATSRK
jgi:hypothetical protein